MLARAVAAVPRPTGALGWGMLTKQRINRYSEGSYAAHLELIEDLAGTSAHPLDSAACATQSAMPALHGAAFGWTTTSLRPI